MIIIALEWLKNQICLLYANTEMLFILIINELAGIICLLENHALIYSIKILAKSSFPLPFLSLKTESLSIHESRVIITVAN